MSEAASQAVQSLFVTLRRGYAGTPWFHRRILEALGLKHRHQCVEKPNNQSIRGMLSKVPHLVVIETDRMFFLRSMKQYYEQLPREPWVLQHPLPATPQQPQSPHSGALPEAATAAAAAPALLTAGPSSQPPQQQQQRQPTRFARQQLQEHVAATGMEGYAASALRPLPPRKYFVEQRRRQRAKILTEHGIFSPAAAAEHAAALRRAPYRRRVGMRD